MDVRATPAPSESSSKVKRVAPPADPRDPGPMPAFLLRSAS
jgi:hypothetical protein